MIVYRDGLSFRIDATGASDDAAKAGFAHSRAEQGLARGIAAGLNEAALDYRRWWAETQPEVGWAIQDSRGAYVVDVSQAYWREKSFLLTFELPDDATRFALIFLGLDQAACDALARSDA